MKDLVKYTETGQVPEYMPGISAYGQKGSFGDPGEDGASFYYTAYDLTPNAIIGDYEYMCCLRMLNMGYELSDNYEKKNEKPYKAGDKIMDCKGKIWKVVKLDDPVNGDMDVKYTINGVSKKWKKVFDIVPAMSENSAMFKETSSLFRTLSMRCSTSVLNSSVHKWALDKHNINFEEYDEMSSIPHLFHRNKYTPYIYGNYVTFELTYDPTIDLSSYYMRYVLVFPNGQTFESTKQAAASTEIFVDNAYVYGCYDLAHNTDINQLQQYEEDIVKDGDIDNEMEGSLESIINYKRPKRYNDSTRYSSETDPWGVFSGVYGESSKKVSDLCSFFIKNNCTGYVEITNIVSGATYRVDLTDKFVDKYGNEYEYNPHKDFVQANEPMLKWKMHEYPEYKWILDPESTVLRKSSRYVNVQDTSVYRPMDTYISYEQGMVPINDTVTDDNKMIPWFFTGEEGIRQQTYSYLDSNGYLPGGAANDGIDAYHRWVNEDNGRGERNRTMRMYFKNLSRLNLTIEFAKIEGSFTSSLVYIGLPDCNLIQFGPSDGSVGSYNVEHPGIYYMHKILPPAVYEEGDTSDIIADAGIVNLNINLKEFKLSPSDYHFVEFGIVSFGTIHDSTQNAGTKHHRPFTIDEEHANNLWTPPQLGRDGDLTKDPILYQYYWYHTGVNEVNIYVNHTAEDISGIISNTGYKPSNHWKIDTPDDLQEENEVNP